MTSASILPTSATPGERTAFTGTIVTNTSTTSGIVVSPEWDWPVTYGSRSSDTVTVSGNVATCANSLIVFTAVGGTWSTPPSQCTYTTGGGAPDNHQVELTGAVASAETTSITIDFPSGVVTPVQSARGYGIWTFDTDRVSARQVRVSTLVDIEGNPVPVTTLNIDGNGGTCTVNAITGYQSTWTIAPDARFPGTPGEGSCSKDSAAWVGFNTSPDGSGLAISKGGNLHLTGDNTLYAQYAENRLAGPPTAVKITSGWNSINVEWSAPADPGTYSITNYLVQATPGGSVCITRLADANMLSCTYGSLTPGVEYTLAVQALTGVGWGPKSTATAEASPFDLRATSVKRAKRNIAFVNVGSKLTVGGTSAGYAPGATITPWIKVGGGKWEADKKSAFKANSSGKISWTKDLPRNQNSAKVTVRFSDGTNFSNEVVLPAV